jgi:outer membrane receptor protein involved in Fe transport
MKQVIMAALWLCLSISFGYAQNITGKVLTSKETPIVFANVIVENTNIGTSTNNDGTFSLSLTPGDYKLTFSSIGYISKTQTITIGKTSQFISIVLVEDIEALSEVVVSASRELQKRADVPAAISAIGAKAIKETKAFGIDQLVNQVPGVYMSTSRVASNEQHFMSVRSPISTKALFLFLEDGLQIRPTSVFNHNALLEMNNLSYERIEVLKGPASSIYGSESIGGSFNFITKNPTPELSAMFGFQINDMGLKRYEFEFSKQTSKNFGFYLGTHYVNREDGPIAHSDYEKFALTFKTVFDISETLNWTTVFDIIDYRSDMTGSLSESDYNSENFESDQTFTERDALAFRVRNTFTNQWNAKNKTTFNMVFRDNKMDQNPSYRIRQFREMGQLTGFGSGEVNSNQFTSFMGLIQHKTDFKFKKSSLIVGGTLDYSPQNYVSEKTDVIVNTDTGQNIDFTVRNGDYNLNYEADIFNYAGFFQYEISPLENLKLTAALRYDKFEYKYDNQITEAELQSSKDSYDNWTPKFGANYNFNKKAGVYINYSQGFTPPQVSTLYRNRNELRDIKPSNYHNYEIGGYASINATWKLDGAIYLLDGKNTLITLRDDNDVFFNTNAGETRSYGIEYGITFSPTEKWSFTHNGSYAKHKYLRFYDNGVDYSDTDRETAPSLLGTTLISFRPLKDLSLTAEHELVGKYNTSFEGQVSHDDGATSTATYDGHNVFNLRASYRYKNFEIWLHCLNIFDELYSARASYNRFRNANRYTIGNPRAFHAGFRIHL